MKKLSHYLKEELISFSKASSKEEVIQELVDLLDKQNLLDDPEAFHKAILVREALISTAIGMGIAIPHAKLSQEQDFFLAIAIHAKGIPWKTPDNQPVKLVFMVGGSEQHPTEYLRLLSQLTLALKDERRRKKMLQLNSPKQILELFQDI